MDILLLFEYPTLCGGEQSMLCLLPLLQAAGCRLRAAAPGEGPLAEALRKQDIEVLPITLHDAFGVRLPLETCRAALAKLLKQSRPDLLHANSLSMTRLSGPVAADGGVPSVGHIRDIVGLSRRAVQDVNRHSALLAVSNAARDFHIAQGVEAQRIKVLYNGVDLELFRPRAATGFLHRELKLPPGAPLLAAIGQIGPRKGLDQLMLAMQRVAGEWPNAHLLIIGERFSEKGDAIEFERSLHEMASKTPLAGRVHFLGWRMDIAALLPELTLLVHAAKQEPLGRVLLEGAACGCSIVATDVGGTVEIFGGSHSGALLIPPGNPQVMAEAILQWSRQPSPKVNHNSRLRMEHLFGSTETAGKLITHWKDAILARLEYPNSPPIISGSL
ncbi:MAG: glycosyltransferase family 4 protein [Planctomycetes bacterium]|nr:glycosyltransferase family 4 protein [Planctomycetota bacterium]